MEIQQHDGVVVEVAGDPGRASPSANGRERCHGREREAPGAVVLLPSLPPLFIGPLEGGRRPWNPSTRGAAARGGNSPPPSQVGRPPPPGFPTLGAGGGPWGAPPAH